MQKPVVRFFLTEEARNVNLVFRAPRELDAGFDLPSLEAASIPPGGFALIRTGVHLSIPENWVGLLRDRSSVAMRGGAITAGVIDASYRGEVKVAMHNFGKETLQFKLGERIAQCLIVPHLPGTQSEEVSSLDDLGGTERGDGGFGSTGR